MRDRATLKGSMASGHTRVAGAAPSALPRRFPNGYENIGPSQRVLLYRSSISIAPGTSDSRARWSLWKTSFVSMIFKVRLGTWRKQQLNQT